MKEFVMIIGFLTAVIQLMAGISAFMIVSDLTNDFNKYMDKIKEDPNPKHLNDYFKELSDDLVNLTINEIKDIPRDILLDEIQEK